MRSREPDERSYGTLMSVIRTYIVTGEPVGSRTVSRQHKGGLSPASIRNIMMDLEEEGYLEQPHTSAGRVPTEKAYRYYASQCDATQPPGKADEILILTHLAGVRNLSDEVVLERTSHVLSLISRNIGVVVRERIARAVLEHIHFVCLGERRILVVLVCPNSQVRNHVIHVDSDISQPELEAAANYLNHHFRGWTLGKIRETLITQLAEERAAYDRVLKDLKELNAQGMLEDNPRADVYLEGTSNLIGRPELSDPSRMRELMKALEEKETLVRLLSLCIPNPGDPLQVVIGLPGKPPLLKNFALIGTPFSWQGGDTGRLAIMGPARMPYDRVIRAVGYIGRLLQEQERN